MCRLGVVSLPYKLSLILHGLHEQAQCGDVQGKQPICNLKARAHWNAWAAMSGLGKVEAMHRYIAIVEKLTTSGMMPVHATLVDEIQACKAAEALNDGPAKGALS